jgi:hypothetical protein
LGADAAMDAEAGAAALRVEAGAAAAETAAGPPRFDEGVLEAMLSCAPGSLRTRELPARRVGTLADGVCERKEGGGGGGRAERESPSRAPSQLLTCPIELTITMLASSTRLMLSRGRAAHLLLLQARTIAPALGSRAPATATAAAAATRWQPVRGHCDSEIKPDAKM